MNGMSNTFIKIEDNPAALYKFGHVSLDTIPNKRADIAIIFSAEFIS